MTAKMQSSSYLAMDFLLLGKKSLKNMFFFSFHSFNMSNIFNMGFMQFNFSGRARKVSTEQMDDIRSKFLNKNIAGRDRC